MLDFTKQQSLAERQRYSDKRDGLGVIDPYTAPLVLFCPLKLADVSGIPDVAYIIQMFTSIS
jgi:hypothetical protein